MAAGAGDGVVIGVDSSTQATKALAVDVATGKILGRGRAAHAVSGGAGRESEPEQWWEALSEALDQTGYAETAAAVSIGGQQHGLVALDEEGRSVHPALLWNDVRSAPNAEALVERLGARTWAERVGSVPGASFTVTKWDWLREHHADAAKRVRRVMLPHDYLTWRLTGEHVTDRGDVSGTGWWGPDGYDREILSLVGLDESFLPRVAEPGSAAGTVRGGLPLRAGIPVGTGTGDNMAAALGLGLEPGAPVISLGTSGTAYAVTRGRPTDPTGTVAGFADALGNWLPLACTLNCTLAVDRVAQWLGLDREAVEPGGQLVVLPYLDGERTPNLPYASGLFYGLRHDTTPGQILRAAYEGAAASLLTAVDEALRAGSEQAAQDAPLILIGGGAKGDAWRTTVRRLSGRPVLVPQLEEIVAIGAATQAAALVTGERADEVARRWKTLDGTLYDPLTADQAVLERIASVRRRAEALVSTEI
ncbi:xylulokinase [Actinospica sp.]|jgi:xylulokinase|uniref:xylulokinase n=1 Tax=Actinospica sp. TaxID=1872142 RepID=UPI002D038D13|nr:xylulokinase [Actinospica sp.]HWG22929.1 xylulokinase [Actinospica sp.]